jgi:Domain of unknown function (DUF4157)
MSARVVISMQKLAATHVTPSNSGFLQRQCACGNHTVAGGTCEGCSKKKQLGPQTKLKVNQPGDIYEQEADRIADQVMATPAHSAISAAPPRIQRFSEQSNGLMDAAPASVDQALASPGRPLEPALRQDMEQRFSRDFSQVRLHSGAAAEQSAQDVNALAYTVGHNIIFGSGQFAPQTYAGRRTIAHELTHVVQQSDVYKTAVDKTNERGALHHLPSRHVALNRLVQRQVAPPAAQPGGGQQTSRQQPQPAARARLERESLDPAGRPGKPVRAEVYRSPSGGPAVLTVTLRCSIVFAERPLGANPGRPIQLPSPAQQATWRRNYTERVSKAWSFKHYLDLDGPCLGERPRAVVNFRAIDRGSPDVTIYVYSWTPFGWRSHVQGNKMHLDIGDVDANFGSGQVVAGHETGHSVGLSHIGCDTNDPRCYGMFNEAADIMGGGPTVSARDYQVFAEIMGQVTGCQWKVTQASAPPHNYLPLILGGVFGAAGAVLGGLAGLAVGGPLGAFIGAGIGGLGLGFGFGAIVGATGGTVS